MKLAKSIITTMGMALGTGSAWSRAHAQETVLSSSNIQGDFGSLQSRNPDVSPDGRWVVFASRAKNFVPNDTNGVFDIFLKDMETGEIIRISESNEGEQGNDFSTMVIMSGDGTVVAFMSGASNLVPDDNNNTWDYFVYDLKTGLLERVNVNSQGEEGDQGADCECRVFKFCALSHDGRYVSFHSLATNLVEDDTNGVADVFRHDRVTGETIRVSMHSDGTEGNDHMWNRDISADGRYIAMHGYASNLIDNDENEVRDIFLHDVDTGETELISITQDGGQTNERSDSPRINGDGRYVTYASYATNLTPDDENGSWDVFVRDRLLGTTERVSVSTDGEHGNNLSRHPTISNDGRFIAWHSTTTNLVPGDDNEVRDILMRDMWLNETIRLSKSSTGVETDERSYDANLTTNGRFLTYDSLASNLVEGDSMGIRHVYVYDRWGGRLDLSSPVPGGPGEVSTWQLSGANAGASAYLLYSTKLGSSNMPGCEITLDLKRPQLVQKTMIEADGVAQFKAKIPNVVIGKTIHFQVYEPISCRKSAVQTIEF